MTRPGRFPAVLTDPRVQLGVSTAALLATASTVRQDRVGPREATAFRAVNGLPDSWYRPAWAVMQLGAFGAVPATAATAWLAGDGELAGRLLADGTGTWALSKGDRERDVHLRTLVRRGVVSPMAQRCRGQATRKWEKRMKFLMLVCVEEDRFENEAAATAEEATASDTADSGSFPWLDDVIARGIRLDGDRLRPPREAKTVLVRDGEILISDGPFAETKEIICGYDVLECANISEAVQVAAAHPVAAFGKIEVRPFWP